MDRAGACPKLPKNYFDALAINPAHHAKQVVLVFVGIELGLLAPRCKRGRNNPPAWVKLRGYAPLNLQNVQTTSC